MGGLAGQKVVHPLARRASQLPGRFNQKFAAKMKMVTPREEAWGEVPCRCAQFFLPNNQFTYGIFAVVANGFCNPKCLSG
jgi:hypothetical protein